MNGYRKKRLLFSIKSFGLCCALIVYVCMLPAYAYVFSQDVPASAPAMEIGYQAMTRDETRAFAVETLSVLACSGSVSQKERAAAQEELLSLLDAAQKEASIEEELLARGFGRCVANVSNRFVSLIMETEIDGDSAAAVMELISSISGCNNGNIRLIPLKTP